MYTSVSAGNSCPAGSTPTTSPDALPKLSLAPIALGQWPEHDTVQHAENRRRRADTHCERERRDEAERRRLPQLPRGEAQVLRDRGDALTRLCPVHVSDLD